MGQAGTNGLYTMSYLGQHRSAHLGGLVDGVPGCAASAKEIAKWRGKQTEWFGLPRQLFVQASIPEVTTIWADARDDIRDVPDMT